MRICKSRDLRADEYEQVLRLLLKADETKNKQTDKKKKKEKKGFIAITMKNSLLI